MLSKESKWAYVLYTFLAVAISAFVVFLVLYIIEVGKNNERASYETWVGTDGGVSRYFGLDLARKQILTFNSSFEVVGASDVDVSASMFTATIAGPPSTVLEWRTNNLNSATIVIDPDASTRRTVQLTRLTLQSLTVAFNSVQSVPAIPTLFNQFY